MSLKVHPSNAGFTNIKPIMGSEEEAPHRLSPFLPIAHNYVGQFPWTSRCLGFWEGMIVPDLVGVFLYYFRPDRKDVPEWHWFVVGTNWPYPDYDTTTREDRNRPTRESYVGLPNAYIWTGAPDFAGEDAAPNPACALASYAVVIEGWAEAVLSGASLDEEYPVDVPAGLTIEQYAAAVRAKLRVVKDDVLPRYDDQLRACDG